MTACAFKSSHEKETFVIKITAVKATLNFNKHNIYVVTYWFYSLIVPGNTININKR